MNKYSVVFLLSLLPFAAAAEDLRPHVPEPVAFDLVRPLGPNKGDVEINTYMRAPISKRSSSRQRDPFSSAPTSEDTAHFEWAPEIEYALSDTVALEFELPFEKTHLEQYKVGAQKTFGTAFNNQYIHGMQLLVQPTTEFTEWNTTLLYLAGLKLSDKWSTLLMAGGRMDLERSGENKEFETVINPSVFYTPSEKTTLGFEVNTASSSSFSKNFVAFIPQIHKNVTENISLQFATSLGFEEGEREVTFIFRPVLSW